MENLNVSAEDLIRALLSITDKHKVYILDSCGVFGKNRLLLASFDPIKTLKISHENPKHSLTQLDDLFKTKNVFCIFTISYDFGLKLNKIESQRRKNYYSSEPDIFLAIFDFLIMHDYQASSTYLVGNRKKFAEVEKSLDSSKRFVLANKSKVKSISSDLDQSSYESAIRKIQDFICRGDTYQVNLTREILVESYDNPVAAEIFFRLRRNHPVPFAAFIDRGEDQVVSASPEQFFRIEGRTITASPIKGTRKRGKTAVDDKNLMMELSNSEKERAENIMIVDLMRNDLGRICEFGSIEVKKLCEIEAYSTLFQMVSTISGKLRDNVEFSDVLTSLFPCGSVTGAPKIRTMQIIEALEPSSRGLSMGAIGYHIANPDFAHGMLGAENLTNCSVAIRTMNISSRNIRFKVGGGIVIDSEPSAEYEETNLKAKALLNAIGVTEEMFAMETD